MTVREVLVLVRDLGLRRVFVFVIFMDMNTLMLSFRCVLYLRIC